jgi:hypothetical protein
MARIYGFDWHAYEKRIMPAFAKWLIDDDETAVLQMYEQTRCAREEGLIPPSMREMSTWSRALTFLRQLPRGPYSYREYHKLCDAVEFSELSDLYVYRHPPQLYQNADAIRAVWGALIEEFCVPWLSFTQEPEEVLVVEEQAVQTSREEVAELLQSVGLADLVQEMPARQEASAHQDLNVPQTASLQPEELPQYRVAPQQDAGSHYQTNPQQEIGLHQERGAHQEAGSVQGEEVDQLEFQSAHSLEQNYAFERMIEPMDEEPQLQREAVVQQIEEQAHGGPPGIYLGRHPMTLHLRGWLATVSVRAMALFELLACGRRAMPFGYRTNEPFEAYVGYLTPDEVWQLALSLRNVQPPSQEEAEEDYKLFRLKLATESEEFNMIDEVLPAHAGPFMRMVRIAASQGLGLICSVD